MPRLRNALMVSLVCVTGDRRVERRRRRPVRTFARHSASHDATRVASDPGHATSGADPRATRSTTAADDRVRAGPNVIAAAPLADAFDASTRSGVPPVDPAQLDREL